MIDHTEPDVFAPFYRTALQARSWRRWALSLGGVVAVQSLALCLLALRPPWVVVKDRVDGQAPAVTRMRSDPALTVADARLFFTRMVRLRFGWQSTTVRRDLEEFLLQCHPSHRRAQLRHLQAHAGEEDKVGPSGSQGGSEGSRLSQWQRLGIVNDLVLPLHAEDVHCRPRADQPVWDCTMQADIGVRTQQGDAAVGDVTMAPSRRAIFVATFVEVPHTAKTPYGLLVAHLDLQMAGPQAPAWLENQP